MFYDFCLYCEPFQKFGCLVFGDSAQINHVGTFYRSVLVDIGQDHLFLLNRVKAGLPGQLGTSVNK
jgi:hypothetical protein